MEDYINDRLNLGKARYGHGVRVNDDTTTFGTPFNSWMQMALEEYLDAVIYLMADYIRNHEPPREDDEEDDNERIMDFIMNRDTIQSRKHREMLDMLTQLIFFVEE